MEISSNPQTVDFGGSIEGVYIDDRNVSDNLR